MISQVLGESVAGNETGQYFFAVLVFFGVYIFLRIFKLRLVKHLKIVARKSSNELDDLVIDVIDKIHWSFYMILSFFAGIQVLDLPEKVFQITSYAIVIVGTYYAVRVAESLVDFGLERVLRHKEKKEIDIDKSALRALGGLIKGLVWAVAVLMILQNLGYNITTLVAGLGIGGLAIGLALKNVLGDIFASFSIYLDKPFKTGDFIVVGEDKGTVAHIGIKSTRLKTLNGDELVVSNEELTDSRIHNFKKLTKRRGVFQFGVTYDTPVKKLKRVSGIVSLIIEGIEKTELDRVHFKEFGDSALVYEVVYFLDDKNYGLFMDIQQDINFKIIEAFEREKIEMAFPTQTIYLKK